MGRMSRAMKTRRKEQRKVAAAVIEKYGKVLVARRRPGLVAGGLWEFPGGKVEEGEDVEKCLARELEEELGVSARVGEFLCSVPFVGSSASFELVVHRAELLSEAFRLTDHDDVRWLEPAEMDENSFSKPDRPVVQMLAGRKAAGPRRKGRRA